MIVAFVILGVMLAPLLGTLMTVQKSFVWSRQRSQVAGSVRYAQLSLTRFMRIAGSNPYGASFIAIDPDPRRDGLFDDVRLRADYNPADGDTDDLGEDLTFYVRGNTMFVRFGVDGVEEPYLVGIDSLAFEYYDRDGSVITDLERVAGWATSVRMVVRGRAESEQRSAVLVLAGLVHLRNGG
jgi:hypothetical protein